MNLIKQAVFLLTAGLLAVSCAKSEDETYPEMEDRSFERWMSKYINTNPADSTALRLSGGGYIQWLETDPAHPDIYIDPTGGEYVEINYRGMLLTDWDHTLERGSIFMTRSKEDAERLGTFQYYTHYVPQLIVYSLNNGIMEGMQDALVRMKETDKVRLYLPSAQAYTTTSLTPSASSSSSSSSTTGYEGNTTQTSSQPVIVELEFVRLVKDPQKMEEDSVEKYANTAWEKNVKVDNYLLVNIDESTMTRDTVGMDSTINMYYTARLAYDDFIIETNIDSIAKKNNLTVSTTTSYKPSSGVDSPAGMGISAFTKIFESDSVSLTYGTRFEFITTSVYGFGKDGRPGASGTTEVLPFQPLRYEVYIEEYDHDE